VVDCSVVALRSQRRRTDFLRRAGLLPAFLIPAQWLVAGHSQRVGHALFTLLAALLVTEVGWMIAYELAPDWAVVMGVTLGLIIAILFFRTSSRGC
jgi:hypothetical protein